MTQNQGKTREYLQDAASSGIWLKYNVCTANRSMVITGICHVSQRRVSALWWKCVFSLRNDVSQFNSHLSAKLMTVIYAVTNESLLYFVMSTPLQLGISERRLELQQTHTYEHTMHWRCSQCIDSESRFWFCSPVLKELLKTTAGGRCHPLLYMTQWGSRGLCDTSMHWHAAHLICLHQPCIESNTYGQMQWPCNDHSDKDSALTLQSFTLHLCLFTSKSIAQQTFRQQFW